MCDIMIRYILMCYVLCLMWDVVCSCSSNRYISEDNILYVTLIIIKSRVLLITEIPFSWFFLQTSCIVQITGLFILIIAQKHIEESIISSNFTKSTNMDKDIVKALEI